MPLAIEANYKYIIATLKNLEQAAGPGRMRREEGGRWSSSSIERIKQTFASCFDFFVS